MPEKEVDFTINELEVELILNVEYETDTTIGITGAVAAREYSNTTINQIDMNGR